MRIGLFINNFFKTQSCKDPGIIAESLCNLGHEVTIYCFSTDNKKFGNIEIKKISKNLGNSIKFWQKEDVDTIILYSWLSLRFLKMIKALKKANKKLLLKLDSDGHLISPLKPTYLRTFGRKNSPKQWIIHLIRILQWYIFGNIISHKKIKQLLLCDGAIIESPLALNRLNKSLKHWNKNQLIKKIHFIPNPINDDITKQIITQKKENTIISIGRWNDKQKNKKGLLKVIAQYKTLDWKIILIGQGSDAIKNKIIESKKTSSNINIESFEKIEHKEIFKYLISSKIIFAPSNYESFNLAVAEALCCGCSLAGTPIESFYYFSQNKKFGSISKNFNSLEIKKTIEIEIDKWNKKEYSENYISEYWKKELNAKKVCQDIDKLLKNL